MKAIKRTKAWLAIFLAMAMALVSGSASATGYEILGLQSDSPEIWEKAYVPPPAKIGRMKMPLVAPEPWAVLYVAPEEGANMASVQPSEYIMRYLGTEGDYYKALTFAGKRVYIKISEARRSSQSVDYAKYPAGTYAVGRTVVLEEGEFKEDPVTGVMETVSMGKTETRPWSEAVLEGRDYYLKSDPGKEATLVVSTDREGKKIVSKSQGDGIVHLEGQYVTVKDGSLYSHFLAPSAALLQDMEERPALYSPGTGTPYDPQEDYAWTDEMGMVVLY